MEQMASRRPLAAARHSRHTRPLDHYFTSRDESPHGRRRPIISHLACHSASGARRARSTRALLVCRRRREWLGDMARASPHTTRRRRGPVTAHFIGISRACRCEIDGWRAKPRTWAGQAVTPYRGRDGRSHTEQVGGDFGASTPTGVERRVALCSYRPQ